MQPQGSEEAGIIAQFEVPGKVVPYAWHPSGYRNAKDMKAKRKNAELAQYKAAVTAAAKTAMAGSPPYRGRVELHITLVYLPSPGFKDGDPWPEPIKLNEKGVWVKTDRDEWDVTNALKSTEDALEGAVIVNDAQVNRSIPEKLYGQREGVRIVVKEYARRA